VTAAGKSTTWSDLLLSPALVFAADQVTLARLSIDLVVVGVVVFRDDGDCGQHVGTDLGEIAIPTVPDPIAVLRVS
jgi:hypothetical protein